MKPILCHLLLCGVGVACQTTPFAQRHASAQAPQENASFRVVTKVFAGDEEEPAAEHLILFHDGLVYDLPQIDDRQCTTFDLKRGRVILLDRQSQVRATISTEELMKLSAELRAKATNDKTRAQLGLSAEVQQSEDGSEYSVAYGPVEYVTVARTPEKPDVASRFGQFIDWASRMNIARALGMPPFGRMEMNKVIAEAGKVPHETTLTYRPAGRRKVFRSTHELVERISQPDMTKIDEVGGMLATYREVAVSDFPVRY